MQPDPCGVEGKHIAGRAGLPPSLQRTLQMPGDGSQSTDNPEHESEPKNHEQSFKLRLIKKKKKKKAHTGMVSCVLLFCFLSCKVYACSISVHPEGLSIFLSEE